LPINDRRKSHVHAVGIALSRCLHPEVHDGR
jgi:hypothetical protein